MPDDLLQPGWTSRFVHANGCRFHLVEAGPAGGLPLLLLHGFPEFWWAWRNQITPLAEAGFHVIVPDMRGYNLSDAPEGIDAYAIDILADDVVALADALGIGGFQLVGHDWGGVVAWWSAVRHPDRIRRLAIMDAPHPDIFARQVLRHPTQALRSAYAMFFQLPWVPEMALGAFSHAGVRALMKQTARRDAFEPSALDRYAGAWSGPGRMTAMLNYYRALSRRRPPAQPNRIKVDTLVLWGENDSALEHHVAEASVALCDHGRLQVIDNTTHWLHLEEPERVLEALLRFLQH